MYADDTHLTYADNHADYISIKVKTNQPWWHGDCIGGPKQETVAMLVDQHNPQGIKVYFHASNGSFGLGQLSVDVSADISTQATHSTHDPK